MLRKPKTILFQGDSITDCGRDREGNPPHHLGHGYPHIIANLLNNQMAEEGLLEPFILKGIATEERWEDWRAKLDDYGHITLELAKEFDAVFVPLQAVFDQATEREPAEYWLYDGVHPTAAGHDLIVGEWLAAVGYNAAEKLDGFKENS